MRLRLRSDLRLLMVAAAVGLALLVLGAALPLASAQTGGSATPQIGADRAVDFPYDM